MWQVAGHESHPPCARQGQGVEGLTQIGLGLLFEGVWVGCHHLCQGHSGPACTSSPSIGGRATFLRLKERYIETCTSFFAGRSVPSPQAQRCCCQSRSHPLRRHPPTTGRTRTSNQPTETHSGWISSPLLPLSRPPTSLTRTALCTCTCSRAGGQGKWSPIETQACTSTYSPVNDMQHSGRVYIGGPRGPRTPGVLADTGNVPLPYCV